MKNLLITFLLVGVIGTGAYFAKSFNPQNQPVVISNPQQNTEQDTIEPEKDDKLTEEDTIKLISQAGLDFKIVIEQEPRNLIVYKKTGNDWAMMDSFEYDGYYKHLNEQISFSDWNEDGFVDILTHWRNTSVINLFDFNKKRFVKTGDFSEITKLEKGYSFEYEYIRPVWVSTLYRIEDFKKVVYATMSLEMPKEGEIQKILVYKGNIQDHNILETLSKETEYDDYWRKNWKRFVK